MTKSEVFQKALEQAQMQAATQYITWNNFPPGWGLTNVSPPASQLVATVLQSAASGPNYPPQHYES